MSKLNSKKDKLDAQLNKLKTAAEKADYETKVPQNVREQNQQKVGPHAFILLSVHDTWFSINRMI